MDILQPASGEGEETGVCNVGFNKGISYEKNADMTDTERDTAINIEGLNGGSCQVFYMGGWPMESRNEIALPEQIVPEEKNFSVTGNSFSYCFPKKSFTVFRIRQTMPENEG